MTFGNIKIILNSLFYNTITDTEKVRDYDDSEGLNSYNPGK